jgi:hypothetical protein
LENDGDAQIQAGEKIGIGCGFGGFTRGLLEPSVFARPFVVSLSVFEA